ncbi:hypothetical protein [Rhodococcus rhodochrous]|uniref:hypothetical protein n=1 Tax=Rhodococcus rhodochrous TaxID=1829 RepID=UPI0017827A27|nr:hypothetical protein [Rhodococcus rhodochrous]QOH59913.1 hypothetical protein C6Y44_27885 [Rhodococcus rhodochrous]
MRRRLANRLRALAHRLHPLPGPTLPATAFTGQVPRVPQVQNVPGPLHVSSDAIDQMNRYLSRRHREPAHGTVPR